MSQISIPEARKLNAILERLQADVKSLKGGSTAPQLQQSSIEITEGRGYIPIFKNGQERHRVGRLPDGTVGTASFNNNEPPAIPNDPQCTPGLGTVSVKCTGFIRKQFLDFSHINVYRDGAVVGTLMKVPESWIDVPDNYDPHTYQLSSVNLSGTQSPLSGAVVAQPKKLVGDDILDGIITQLQLADDAVTEAKLAADSVTTEKVVYGAIGALQIAAAQIYAEHLTSNSVTADKIQALAITAAKIAANAIESGHIKAGSITASKLESTLIITNQFIAGDPLGRRLVLDALGLTQVDARGNISIQLGSTSNQGNFLTVIDPTDPENALASIAQDGSGSFNGLAINGNTTLNGIDLIQFLNRLPLGVIAQGSRNGNTPTTTSRIGLFEISADLIAGRFYRLQSSPMSCIGQYGGLSVRYTSDGSIPNINSTQLTASYVMGLNNSRLGNGTFTTTAAHFHYFNADQQNTYYTNLSTGTFGPMYSENHAHTNTTDEGFVQISFSFVASNTGRYRFLFCVQSGSNNAAFYMRSSNVGSTVVLTLEDIGIAPTTTGGDSDGGGTSNANGEYVRTYSSTYSKYKRIELTGQAMQDGLSMGLADYTYVSMIGFDYNTIKTTLTGATVSKVELYLYSNYWSMNEGGYVSVGTHTATTTPTSYSFAERDLAIKKMKKPQGLWIELPISVADKFLNNAARGIVLDCRNNYPSATNYAQFRGTGYVDATVRPALRFTFTK